MKRNAKRKSLGFTLLEVLAALAVILVVIGGVTALFGQSSASASAATFTNNVMALRSATKAMYPSSAYGTASLNSTLQAAGKIPSNWSTSGSDATMAINHSLGGTVTVTGATGTFTIAVSNLPTDVCTDLVVSLSTGWSQVQVGSATALTSFPVTGATASSATNCGASTANTVTWTAA